MHGRPSKKKTKRVTLSMKYKIQRKVKEHQRKLKKEMKKNPGKFRKRKDPGVPNSLPFKAEVINEAKENKEKEEERRKTLNEMLKSGRKEKRNTLFDANRNIGDFAENAKKRGKDFEAIKKITSEDTKFTDKSAKAYYKEFKKVVEAADVILEILDARDPQGSRCTSMEELVKNTPNKRLVLVLNKVDLVPKDSLEKWLKYLRREYPTVLFKASVQSQSRNLSQSKIKALKKNKLQVTQCIGADFVMQLLKNYCRNCGIKTAITVGVVGLPNVGKSSFINSMKRSKACNVGAIPGITKNLQEVTLDSKVRLIDTPGVIFPARETSDDSSSLRNAFRIDSLKDPIPAFQAIFEKAGSNYMMLQYGVPAFDGPMEFLAIYAKKSGKLRGGGKPQINIAAKMILQDWNTGKIKYYTTPPVVEEAQTNSTLVKKMSEEFSLNELSKKEKAVLNTLPEILPSDVVETTSSKPFQASDEVNMEDESDESEMETEASAAEGESQDNKLSKENGATILPENMALVPNDNKMVVEESAAEKIPRWETKKKEVDLSKVSLKKLQKVTAKKQRKERSRNEKRVDDLTTAFQSFDGGMDEENYDFNDYFDKK